MKYIDDADGANSGIHLKEVLFDRTGGVIIHDNEKVLPKLLRPLEETGNQSLTTSEFTRACLTTLGECIVTEKIT